MSRSFLSTVPASVRKAEAAAPRHEFAADPAEVVVVTGKASYRRGDLEAAFSAIQNRDNWKCPIYCAIPAEFLDVAMAAATFYTGTGITVESATADKWAVIRGAEYYATCGA
jgi:hypothetical protein